MPLPKYTDIVNKQKMCDGFDCHHFNPIHKLLKFDMVNEPAKSLHNQYKQQSIEWIALSEAPCALKEPRWGDPLTKTIKKKNKKKHMPLSNPPLEGGVQFKRE